MELSIRPYRSDDWEDLYEICVRTGDNGADASSLYPDPRILPDIFVGPYLALEPELAFVVADAADAADAADGADGEGGDRALGYILGTADTRRFVARYRDEWLPKVVDRYPDDGGRGSELRRPEVMLSPIADAYPAHLHIDLMPQAQGRGFGRRLMDTYLAALRERGVDAVHLAMGAANVSARAFYDRLGFSELARPVPGLVVMGRSTRL
ncbi:GNAT family N-acetyltransferase [Streptacidiphilus fuscans]|uniref:GNAT family N-acetyltransferase n=1 Tax=Streptacidiphilus fuscans TaxID=2789292 RepID=A0A931BBA7_9ACTN|nr:GNAT family N-acetyltransferase [Streptacidiphilus fuscans]MBF9072216.1 GNAT family N-acetyltransferase [Streptacidiphilus fuscans]MBF9073027.1 GNAT family N-acetyltransferase [Streptacidiphilus fuscans]